MTDFFTLLNTTNQSIQAQYQVITTSGGIDPTVLLLAPAIVLLLVYIGIWWFAESRLDVVISTFLLAVSSLMLGDPFLMSVKYATGSFDLTLPHVLMLMAIYEVLMILSLVLTQNRGIGGNQEP